jgi:putative hydrolase of the HAD superfamily
VHVPHGLTWALEEADTPTHHPRYRELPNLSGLPSLVDAIGG